MTDGIDALAGGLGTDTLTGNDGDDVIVGLPSEIDEAFSVDFSGQMPH